MQIPELISIAFIVILVGLYAWRYCKIRPLNGPHTAQATASIDRLSTPFYLIKHHPIRGFAHFHFTDSEGRTIHAWHHMPFKAWAHLNEGEQVKVTYLRNRPKLSMISSTIDEVYDYYHLMLVATVASVFLIIGTITFAHYTGYYTSRSSIIISLSEFVGRLLHILP